MLALTTLLAACAAPPPAVPFYVPPAEGPVATLVGDVLETAFMGDTTLQVAEVSGRRVVDPVATSKVPIAIPAGRPTVGVAWRKGGKFAGIRFTFSAVAGQQYRVVARRTVVPSTNWALADAEFIDLWLHDAATNLPVAGPARTQPVNTGAQTVYISLPPMRGR